MKSISLLFILLLLIISLLSISNSTSSITINDWERPKVEYPEDNPFTEESVALGSTLFFETLLSKDSTLSCQSCHLITEGFADHLPLGEGIKNRKVSRNTPSLMNVAFQPYFMIDGKFSSLEQQVLGPINEHREFDMNADEVILRLKSIPLYNKLSKAAYGEEITIEIVQKAIANFERSLIADNSKFDQFMRGEIVLSQEEERGWKLFNDKRLNCIQCHNGYNFTNYSFENTGLYKIYADSGRALITKQRVDVGKFKVPTLRNCKKTYPYMHNGSLQTLGEVIDHYASGGKRHPSKSPLIKGFKITESEKEALIAFLSTLTDEQFLKERE